MRGSEIPGPGAEGNRAHLHAGRRGSLATPWRRAWLSREARGRNEEESNSLKLQRNRASPRVAWPAVEAGRRRIGARAPPARRSSNPEAAIHAGCRHASAFGSAPPQLEGTSLGKGIADIQ